MADKVFDILLFGPGGQYRSVVQCASRKAAAAAFGISTHYANGYMSVTGNNLELEAAAQKPGTVYWRPLDAHDAPYIERPSN